MATNVGGFEIPITMPKFGGAGSFGGTWTIILIFIIVFVIGLGIAGMWAINYFKTFNKKIVIFENIAGRGFQPVGRDRARLVKIGNEGMEVLYFRKRKIFRSAYGKKMGRNTYWFVIGQDGYWYNVILGDVDAKLGMLDVEPTSLFARSEYTAMAQNIERNYTKKPGIMEKYGQIIISGIFLIIIVIGLIIMLNKFSTITDALAQNLQTSAVVNDRTGQIISSLDNICSRGGGGGMVPAG